MSLAPLPVPANDNTNVTDLVSDDGVVETLVFGGGGADLLGYGSVGDDTYFFDSGDDTYFVDDVVDTVFALPNNGVDTFVFGIPDTGSPFFPGWVGLPAATTALTNTDSVLPPDVDILIMTGHADLQGYGNADPNVLYGNNGNNVLDGQGGVDLMLGGVGNDTYYVNDPSDSCVEQPNQGSDSVFASSNYGLGANIENLTMMDNHADLQGYGNSEDNVITGNSGNNLINGEAGADLMIGGAGNDTYFVDNTADVVVEHANEGTDSIFTSVNYMLPANVEVLVMQGTGYLQGYGNSDDNTLYGNSGDNLLNGGDGADTMIGGDGDDTYFVDNAADVVYELPGQGIDSVFSTVSYTLPNNVEALVLQGSANLAATGNAQNNSVFGNSGDNVIDGGGGADQLTGNSGNDTFVFHAGEANGDTVVDFNGNGAAPGDTLQFVGFGTAAQGATFTQIGNTDQWQIHSGLDGHDETITLANNATVHPSDVLFS